MEVKQIASRKRYLEGRGDEDFHRGEILIDDKWQSDTRYPASMFIHVFRRYVAVVIIELPTEILFTNSKLIAFLV